ncbi:hypothetical protein HDU92_004308 [Lobulomyces angularis]|nr:hypothetical protein HDU92_004308 [Lobulomyces angularis]
MSAKPKTFPVSPMPTIDKDLDPYDFAARVKSRDEYYFEQMIRMQETLIIRDKMKWCYRREGVNHLQNCRHLVLQYMDLLKEMRKNGPNGFKVFVPPAPVIKSKTNSSEEE